MGLILKSTGGPQASLFFFALCESPFESFYVPYVRRYGKELRVASKDHLFIYHDVIGPIDVGKKPPIFVSLLNIVLHSQLSAFWQQPFESVLSPLTEFHNRLDVSIASLSLELRALVLSALGRVDSDQSNLLNRFVDSDRDGISIDYIGYEWLFGWDEGNELRRGGSDYSASGDESEEEI